MNKRDAPSLSIEYSYEFRYTMPHWVHLCAPLYKGPAQSWRQLGAVFPPRTEHLELLAGFIAPSVSSVT